jgi:hypothetical protein
MTCTPFADSSLSNTAAIGNVWAQAISSARIVGLFALCVALACASKPPAVEIDDIAQAQALQLAPVLLRTDAIAAAQRLAARGNAEGKTARAVPYYSLAASLMKRVYRASSKEHDGKESGELFGSASAAATEQADKCRFGVERALLIGEAAGDAHQTVLELYRLSRRLRR